MYSTVQRQLEPTSHIGHASDLGTCVRHAWTYQVATGQYCVRRVYVVYLATNQVPGPPVIVVTVHTISGKYVDKIDGHNCPFESSAPTPRSTVEADYSGVLAWLSYDTKYSEVELEGGEGGREGGRGKEGKREREIVCCCNGVA